ncbi:MAG: excinuclease ABC subunit UvrC [Clostridia bacterium]|nr:excinuclease ABC subunit UvrC [Clostridia bacterium]
MDILARLREKANSLPPSPGVYIMKNRDGEVIYVGKSKKLKNRVTSYFVGSSHTYKTAKLVSHIFDFDYIVCKTEIEALTLENVLIKKHSPRYNIKLKDAKSYPYIKVTSDEYPRLFVTRERRSDRARYYGPYQGSSAAHDALDAVMKIFTLATCKRSFPRDIGKERPCIYKDMGRCIAPCTGRVSAEEYRALVRCAESVLDGNVRKTSEMLAAEMNEAAENMEFERAAVLRDSIRALERLSEKQKVVADSRVNRDVFSLYTSETEGVLAMLSVRDGALVNKNEFILSLSELTSPEDALSLIVGYYDTSAKPPREVMLDFEISDDDLSLLSEYLSLGSKYKVSVRIPERGDGRALCDMARKNAMESARQYRLEGEREDKNLRRLSTLLGLSELPLRIEAYDISNWGNDNITASMIVFEGGKLKKSDYRVFTVKSVKEADDYASMREVIERRLRHIGDGSASLGVAPDLILLDGGATHVSAVRPIVDALAPETPLFGMVKDDYHKTRAITDGEREISIALEAGVYAFIYNLQEEAHRFAVKHSSGAKIRTMTTSSLEKIEGIGPKKARALLSAMPLAKIKNATTEELAAVRGIGRTDAKRIYEYYHKKK